jgi:hypothetical protein
MSAIPSQPHGCPSRARTWVRGFKDRCLTDLAKRQFGEINRTRTGDNGVTTRRVGHFAMTSMVVGAGIEPTTHGSSDHRSTN